MTGRDELEAATRGVDAALKEPITWRALADSSNNAKFFEGVSSNWRFVIVSFGTEYRGLHPGSLGYDGTATNTVAPIYVVRMTREQAERAVSLAEAAARESATHPTKRET